MEVGILLFGPERAAAGMDRATVSVPSLPSTCAHIRRLLSEKYPALRPHLAANRFAINGEYAGDNAIIQEQDEVALIGLVSGG